MPASRSSFARAVSPVRVGAQGSISNEGYMTHARYKRRTSRLRAARSFGTVSVLFAAGAGCGSAADGRFTPETFDEYTEPLTNATIGEGSKIIVIGPGDKAHAAAAEPSDGGVADVVIGTGGNGGAAGSDAG